MNCELCNKHENERNIQEQAGYYLCLSCDCKYSDNQLLTIMDRLATYMKEFDKKLEINHEV